MQLWIILFASFVVSAVSSPVTCKQYRQDYEYNEKTDAFYKLHAIPIGPKQTASSKCIEEGGELVNIATIEDLLQIQSMMKRFPDIKSVLVASDGLPTLEWVDDEEHPMPRSYSDYESVHEYEVCAVVNQMGEIRKAIAFVSRPFVCKVAAKDAPYNEECGVYSNDYESKISATGSCYKVSKTAATWKRASANCQVEGAHLVILNNAEELEIVYNLLNEKRRYSDMLFYAGVSDETSTEPQVSKTVLNQTLEEVGYEPWAEGNSSKRHSDRHCLALDISSHAKYIDVFCFGVINYVCESTGTPMVDREACQRTSSAAPQSGAVSANVMLSLSLLLSVYLFEYEVFWR